jgi:hypothetical protein
MVYMPAVLSLRRDKRLARLDPTPPPLAVR